MWTVDPKNLSEKNFDVRNGDDIMQERPRKTWMETYFMILTKTTHGTTTKKSKNREDAQNRNKWKAHSCRRGEPG